MHCRAMVAAALPAMRPDVSGIPIYRLFIVSRQIFIVASSGAAHLPPTTWLPAAVHIGVHAAVDALMQLSLLATIMFVENFPRRAAAMGEAVAHLDAATGASRATMSTGGSDGKDGGNSDEVVPCADAHSVPWPSPSMMPLAPGMRVLQPVYAEAGDVPVGSHAFSGMRQLAWLECLHQQVCCTQMCAHAIECAHATDCAHATRLADSPILQRNSTSRLLALVNTEATHHLTKKAPPLPHTSSRLFRLVAGRLTIAALRQLATPLLSLHRLLPPQPQTPAHLNPTSSGSVPTSSPRGSGSSAAATGAAAAAPRLPLAAQAAVQAALDQLVAAALPALDDTLTTLAVPMASAGAAAAAAAAVGVAAADSGSGSTAGAARGTSGSVASGASDVASHRGGDADADRAAASAAERQPQPAKQQSQALAPAQQPAGAAAMRSSSTEGALAPPVDMQVFLLPA